MTQQGSFFVGEIGSHTAQLAVLTPSSTTFNSTSYTCVGYASLEALIGDFFATLPADARPRQGALSIDGVIYQNEDGATATVFGLGWQISVAQLQATLGLDNLWILTQAEAIAKGLPFLASSDITMLTATASQPPVGTKLVVIPGSGLGCSGLVSASWQGGHMGIPMPSEAGHAPFHPTTAEQIHLVEALRSSLGYVANANLISGPGIALMYQHFFQAALGSSARDAALPIVIDDTGGDLLPPNSIPYPNELRYQRFEGLTDVSFGPLPTAAPEPLVSAIISRSAASLYGPSVSTTDASESSNHNPSWQHLSADQVSLLALRSAGLTPSPAFLKESIQLPPLPSDASGTTVQGAASGLPSRIATQTFKIFFEGLGSATGDLALSFGATGGVYFAGSIVPKLLNLAQSSTLRTFFQAKGPYAAYLARLPLGIITHPVPAFVGLARVIWEKTNLP